VRRSARQTDNRKRASPRGARNPTPLPEGSAPKTIPRGIGSSHLFKPSTSTDPSPKPRSRGQQWPLNKQQSRIAPSGEGTVPLPWWRNVELSPPQPAVTGEKEPNLQIGSSVSGRTSILGTPTPLCQARKGKNDHRKSDREMGRALNPYLE